MSDLKPTDKHHKITVEEVENYISELENVIARSTRENKRLVIFHKGILQVRLAHYIVYEGTSTKDAVIAYNNIKDVYKEPKQDFTL